MRAELLLVAVMAGLLLFGCSAPVRGPDKTVGPADAKVSMVIYSDFQCPACGAAEPNINRLMGEYEGRVRFVYKHFPLRNIHEWAQKAAEASECALEEGKFWEMHDAMFANQRALSVPDLKRYARQVGLDGGKFDACLDSNEKAEFVEADYQDGVRMGVGATPTFFINGKGIVGGVPITQFRQVIDAELAK